MLGEGDDGAGDGLDTLGRGALIAGALGALGALYVGRGTFTDGAGAEYEGRAGAEGITGA